MVPSHTFREWKYAPGPSLDRGAGGKNENSIFWNFDLPSSFSERKDSISLLTGSESGQAKDPEREVPQREKPEPPPSPQSRNNIFFLLFKKHLPSCIWIIIRD